MTTKYSTYIQCSFDRSVHVCRCLHFTVSDCLVKYVGDYMVMVLLMFMSWLRNNLDWRKQSREMQRYCVLKQEYIFPNQALYLQVRLETEKIHRLLKAKQPLKMILMDGKLQNGRRF